MKSKLEAKVFRLVKGRSGRGDVATAMIADFDLTWKIMRKIRESQKMRWRKRGILMVILVVVVAGGGGGGEEAETWRK